VIDPWSEVRFSDEGGEMRLSTPRTADEITQGLREREPWFYAYEFTNGARNEPLEAELQHIHSDRADAIFPHLDRLFADRWNDVHCFDLACHEGWWSMQVAARGASAVHGIDVRPEHIEKARWIAEVSEVTNVHFEVADLYALAGRHEEQYELVLCLGIFYHLEDPMGALRAARMLTRDVCVLEGQVARPASMTTGWGSALVDRQGPGAIVLPADPNHAQDAGAIVVVPSLAALHLMLNRAGFRAVHLVMPPGSASSMYQDFDRVIIFAYV
jgi:hypothetical protein